MISEKIYIDFKRITGIDVNLYFKDYLQFLQIDYPIIDSYYKGDRENLPEIQLSNLYKLSKRLYRLEDAIKNKANQFNNFSYWEINEELLDSRIKIETISNLSRWNRSSKIGSSFNNNQTVDYIQKQNQTLEQINRDILGSVDPDNDFYRLAINNRVIEENYTPEGGLLLRVNLPNNGQNFNIDSIVDELNKVDDLYGKDIDRNFSFVDNDLKVLTPKETLYQSSEILLNLKKNDNPEFPSQGVDRKLLGANLASFSYPTILRQIYETFKTDDSFSSISLTNIENDGELYRFTFNIEPINGDLIQQQTII